MTLEFDVGSFVSSFLGIIISFYIAQKTIKSSLKSSLESEATWREKLMDVASAEEIGRGHLLRLRASQRYCVNEKQYSQTCDNKGDEVRYIIWNYTDELYKIYILNKKELNKKIKFEDQNRIRNLAIALLKYDYIKRGDNNKNNNKKEKEYKELYDWMNSERFQKH